MPNKPEKEKINLIKQSTLERSVSLLNMTVSGGAKYAGVKWGNLFRSKEKQDEAYGKFLLDQAEKLVAELGKLKGSIMKAGQMLSVYGEHFFPPQVNKILKNLQSDSEAVSWEQMHKVLKRQLGEEKLSQIDINPEPIGAASMGQVYQGTIKATGEKVAIKVQYPGVDQAIDSDLKALKMILSVSNLVPKGPDFESIFKEVRMMLHFETDFRRELANMNSYRELLKQDKRFIIARPYEEYCSNRVLVMSFEKGENIDSDSVTNLPQADRNHLGAAFLELMYREIFEWRLVQTDPHFGNYKIRINHNSPAQIVLLDFGAVRQFPKKYIYPFSGLVYNSIMNQPDECVYYAKQLGFLRDSDEAKSIQLFQKICQAAVEGFLEEYASPSLDGSDPGNNPYPWGDTDLISKLSELGKNAVFAFKLRSPPREAIFLDRKMVGTYFLVAKLKLKMGPRDLILKYLEPNVQTKEN